MTFAVQNATAARPAPSSEDTGATHVVERGDTLWQIAADAGVSLQALIKANPQIVNPDLIYPGDTVHIPGGNGAGSSSGSGAGSVDGAGPAAGVDDSVPVSGRNPASIARQFLDRNASELKRSGDLPMNPNVPSNICCANFVSAVLQKAGLLPDRLHTDSVNTLESTLQSRGWKAVDAAHAKPGDVVIIRHNGGQHTVLVESNKNGHLTLIGSNNRNADGSQRITLGGLWGNAKIYTPPGR
jgi:spore coat assembly protein SafA